MYPIKICLILIYLNKLQKQYYNLTKFKLLKIKVAFIKGITHFLQLQIEYVFGSEIPKHFFGMLP